MTIEKVVAGRGIMLRFMLATDANIIYVHSICDAASKDGGHNEGATDINSNDVDAVITISRLDSKDFAALGCR